MRISKLFLLLYFSGVFFTNCKSQSNTQKNMEEKFQDKKEQNINRAAYAAGRFYSDDPEELKDHISQLFAQALPRQSDEEVMALIVPHAGYVFSGGIAATSFNQIDVSKQYKRLIIIGSSHTTSFSGASIYCKGDYDMPNGTVTVDLELANKLVSEHHLMKCYPEAHKFEHSLEVQLPLLQYKLGSDFKILPIVIGSQSPDVCKSIAGILYPYFNSENLFIISTDFSHYPTYENAYEVDLATAEAIKKNNPEVLLSTIDKNDSKKISNLATSLCGWTSVLTLLYITHKMPDIKVDLLQYKNSGDSRYGEKDRVVGYYSILFSKDSAHNGEEVNNDSEEFILNKEEKTYLLEIARTTVDEFILNGKTPKIVKERLSDNLKMPCGAFVTLHKEGKLRGCIGRFTPGQPLYKVVQEMAIAASTQDHRFTKVEVDELNDIDIEISVLTPLKKINSIDEFELGKHGIYIKKGYNSGTFLPQVAHSNKWTKEEFLGHCARDKARIGWNGWKDAELYTYEAIIFDEKEFKD